MMKYIKQIIYVWILSVLAACGGKDDGAETGSASQTFNAGERTSLLASLSMLYPNGKLPDERLQQSSNDLNETPSVLLQTAETPNQQSKTNNFQSNISAVQPLATSADFAPVQRIQNASLYGAYFFSIYPSEVSSALSTHPNWKLEGPAFWASLATGTGLHPVHRFQNKINGSYLYTIYDAERADIVANYSATFAYEGVAWYAQQTPGTGWSPLYRFRNKTNGTYLFSAYESEKDAIVASYPDVFALEGIGYYVRQDAPLDVPVVSPVVPPTNPVPVTISGALTGLGASKSVVLSLNGGSDLTLNSNAGFTFSGTILSGQTYAVTVKTQPPGQVCSVTNGSGMVPTSNVTNLAVSCLNYVTVGGSVSGLGAGKSLTLRLNGVQSRTFTSDIASYNFSTPVVSGQTYGVLIEAQPVGQICSLANGSGTAIGNVTNVNVTCVYQVKVGGTVNGLGAGKAITLTLNGSTDLTVTTSAFQFPTLLTSGQLYNVVIKTQPIEQTCTLLNNSGTVASVDVNSIAISCVNHVSVSGSITGLNTGAASVILTLNGSSDLLLTSNSSFIFLATIPTGQAYSVVIKTQPVGQSCSVNNSGGLAAGSNITNVLISCVNNASTGLLISEVAGCTYLSSACWFEIYNPTNTTINISAYSFKTNYSYNGTTYSGAHTFILPSKTIAPSAYLVIQGNPGNTIRALSTQRVLINDGGVSPEWIDTNGNLELILNSSNTTVDFVRWGNGSLPATPSHWAGTASVAGINSTGLNNSSIVRPSNSINLQDTNSVLDWINVKFPTPGGQNDVPANAVDADNDGIPDSSELPGSTYAGMDLYSMGARQGVRDIFIEVDHMNSTDPGIIPRAESLQKVVDAFAIKGIAVHFDAGTQFSATFNPINFNLGQGNSTVTYERCVGFDATVCINNAPQSKTVLDWKQANFDLRRLNIFHYMLFGDTPNNSGIAGGSWGIAELFGNDIIITMGSSGLSTAAGTSLNQLINYQSSTIMHELGHNLGLRHGGNEDVNHKPNYYSIMNYLYGNLGLAQSASSIGPFQRFIAPTCGMLNSVCGTPSQFIIDYSNGSGAPLNEAILTESFNIGRGTDIGVYADWNGNSINDFLSYARDINRTGANEILTDHNDWANIVLPFARSYAGEFLTNPLNGNSTPQIVQFDPMSNDKQTFVVCEPTAGSKMIQLLRQSKIAR